MYYIVIGLLIIIIVMTSIYYSLKILYNVIYCISAYNKDTYLINKELKRYR